MARNVTKKSVKQPQSTQNGSVNSSHTTPPASFQNTHPDIVGQFLSTLPQPHIYLVHLDTTPLALKRQVFMVPVCMNAAFILLLAVRGYYAAPTYLNIIIAIYGYDYTGKFGRDTTFIQISWTFVSRFLLFLADYILLALLGSWPWEFVFGNKYNGYVGPIGWRTALGFRDREIIVRRSKPWDKTLKSPWTMDMEMTLKTKIGTAMQRDKLAKTGYLLLDKDWDLDFSAMLRLEELVDNKELDLSELDQCAFVRYQQQWCTYRPNGLPEKVSQSSIDDSAQLNNFKKRFAAVGCEDVFYRWIEMVQFETNSSSGFTEDAKGKALAEMQTMMQSKGQSFTEFVDAIGGVKNLPGMED